jgi:hypothetical protein
VGRPEGHDRDDKDDIVTTLEELPGKMLAIGEDILGGIKQGILDGWGAFSGWLTDQAQKIIDEFLSTFDIGSPSRVFADEVGAPIVQGILLGMERLFPDLLTRAGELGEELLDTITDIAGQVNEAIADAFDAEASIDRQIARNIAAVQKLNVTAGTAQSNLAEALEQSKGFTDPAEAARFFQMRSRQILEEAKLYEELDAARAAGDENAAAALQEQLRLIEAANKAERAAFEQRQNDQSQTEGLQAALAELLGAEGLSSIPGIADILAEIAKLANQLGVGTPILPPPPPMDAGLMSAGFLADRAMGSLDLAGEGLTIVINQDLRGASDPRAISDAAYQAAKRALDEAGQRADVFTRTRR